jgi:hypothetical protein
LFRRRLGFFNADFDIIETYEAFFLIFLAVKGLYLLGYGCGEWLFSYP